MIYRVKVSIDSKEVTHVVRVKTQVGIGDWKPSYEIDKDIQRILSDYYEGKPFKLLSTQEYTDREGFIL